MIQISKICFGTIIDIITGYNKITMRIYAKHSRAAVLFLFKCKCQNMKYIIKMKRNHNYFTRIRKLIDY